jgi:hypothetical protein
MFFRRDGFFCCLEVFNEATARARNVPFMYQIYKACEGTSHEGGIPRYLADAQAESRLWLSPRHPDTPHLCVRDSSGSNAQFILTLGKGYSH